MVSVNDVGRIFIQSMISRRAVSDKLARVLWGKSIEAVKAAADDLEIPYDPGSFDKFITDLNKQLEPLELRLTPTVDEVVGKKLWTLINMQSDGLAQVATDYSPVEIAYFKALVEQIVLASSECYSISSMTALREVNNLKPSMTKTQAEVVLADFMDKGWLVKSKRGRYSLSSRALMELQKYLKTNYEEDIHECTSCYQLLTKGIRCYIPVCSARLHDHCYKEFVRNNNTCKICGADWSQKHKLMIIGEGALGEGEDSRSKKRHDDVEDDSGESSKSDESDESDNVNPEPKPKTAKKGEVKSTKGKRRYKKEAASGCDSMSDEEMEFETEESPGLTNSRARRRRR